MENEERSPRRLSLANVLPGSVLSSIVLNAACPYMCYQLLSARIGTTEALLCAALLPLAGVVLSLVRQRSVDVIGVGVLIGIALLLALNPITLEIERLSLPLNGADAIWQRPALVRAGVICLLGVCVLALQGVRRPPLFFIDRFFVTNNEIEKITVYNGFWQASVGYRRMVRQLNLFWGCGQIVLALLLSVCIFVLPFEQFQLAEPIVVGAGYLALIVLTVQYRSAQMQRWKKDEPSEAEEAEQQV